MSQKVILNNEDIQVVYCRSENYKIYTYDYNGKHNGEIGISKEDIQRIYYAMKSNELNK